MQACFWAAEMDISGWSELLWDELIDICFSDIGLVSPSSPCHLRRYYKMWKSEVEQGGNPSYKNIDACRIILSIVKYLCGTWKNRTIAHAAMWSVMKAQNGMLTIEEWNSSLGMGNHVEEQLALIHEGHTPAMQKRIDNLLLGLVRNNEYVCIRHSDYMVITGNTNIVWKLIILCIEYTHDRVSKNFYDWFFPYLKDYQRLCKRYMRYCEQDKYLKGGHLDIDSDLYPKDVGVFEFEDGSRSYPYMEHPYSQEYPMYSKYMPYGTKCKVTNARRLNYIRRCIIQTVTLLCRGTPNGVDERTPMDFICEDFFAKEMYSDGMSLPQENTESNFNKVPSDWTTRESEAYTTCDARHWWVMADTVVPTMELQDKYSDPAFDALLEQENYYGKRATEEFALYRYIHSLAHYEGIVQVKPNTDTKNVFDAKHILGDEYWKEDFSDEEHESSEVMETITSSKEIADMRMDTKKKDLEVLQRSEDITKLIEEMRSESGRSSSIESDDDSVKMTEDSLGVVTEEVITQEVQFSKRIYSIIKSVSMIRALLTRGVESYISTVSNTMVGKSKSRKALIYHSKLSTKCHFVMLEETRDMISSMQLIKSWNGHEGKRIEGSLIHILSEINDSSRNGFISVKTDSFEKTMLMEVFLSIILGSGSKSFPMPLMEYLNDTSGRITGIHCQEAFGVIRSHSEEGHQCYWNHLRRFTMDFDRDTTNGRCRCSEQDKDSWVQLLRDLYIRHHSFMVNEIMRWNAMIAKDEGLQFHNIYVINEPDRPVDLSVPTLDIILKRIKKTYSSIISNGLIATSMSNKIPTALDILFCS